jgi:N-acetylglucosamine kinase-like BadF-type ATPase
VRHLRERQARYLAGFDGGGTRTTCVLCDAEGSAIGFGVGGRGNYHDIGVPKALASLKSAFAGALEQSGVPEDRIDLEACFGLAGLDSPKDFEIMSGAIRSMRLPSRIGDGRNDLVENDWRTAVAGAFVDKPGVTLIAGTGCVAAAQSDSGRKVARVGGWGHIVDDRGSGYDIGRDALYAAMRDHDGRGPETVLLKLLMGKFGVSEPQGIVAQVYSEEMRVSEIASLAVLVGQAAKEGDEVATEILRKKGRVLGELVVSAASKLKMQDSRFGVSLNGGVFKAGEPLLRPLEESIRGGAPLASVVMAKLPPACGAVMLLLRRAQARVDGSAVARMQSSFKKLNVKAK